MQCRLFALKGADGKRVRVMSIDLHRYGIMVHVKGTSYEDDYWFRDNKRFMIREFSHDAAEAVLKILKHQYGDGYSFRVRRLD